MKKLRKVYLKIQKTTIEKYIENDFQVRKKSHLIETFRINYYAHF